MFTYKKYLQTKKQTLINLKQCNRELNDAHAITHVLDDQYNVTSKYCLIWQPCLIGETNPIPD